MKVLPLPVRSLFQPQPEIGDLNGTSTSFSTVTDDMFSIDCKCSRISITAPVPNTDGGLSMFSEFPAYATVVTSLTLVLADLLTWVLYWQCRTKITQALLCIIDELFGDPREILYHVRVKFYHNIFSFLFVRARILIWDLGWLWAFLYLLLAFIAK